MLQLKKREEYFIKKSLILIVLILACLIASSVAIVSADVSGIPTDLNDKMKGDNRTCTLMLTFDQKSYNHKVLADVPTFNGKNPNGTITLTFDGNTNVKTTFENVTLSKDNVYAYVNNGIFFKHEWKTADVNPNGVKIIATAAVFWGFKDSIQNVHVVWRGYEGNLPEYPSGASSNNADFFEFHVLINKA